jgi:hypothetical protein
MNKILKELLEEVISNIKDQEFKERFQNEIINPFFDELIKKLQPYIIATVSVILLMFLCIIITLFIVIKN